MNLVDKHYARFSLVKEMLETANVVRRFEPIVSAPIAEAIQQKKHLFIAGEGSSRIFPAKNLIYQSKKIGLDVDLLSDGGNQALEYDLSKYVIAAISNSGKTKEIVQLLKKLKTQGHKNVYSLSAHYNTPILDLSEQGFVLKCGNENAVGATKSVVEQTLFMHSVIDNLVSIKMADRLPTLGNYLEKVLTDKIKPSITKMISDATTVYFAGRNNGVAEELTLKTNEIVRKKSDYLEGTYAVHGIEEVMQSSDVVVLIDPFESELEKINEVLIKGVGLNVISISTAQTPFPTIVVPDLPGFNEYIQLACGWSLLVEAGLALNINIDKPVRARKIGNIVA